MPTSAMTVIVTNCCDLSSLSLSLPKAKRRVLGDLLLLLLLLMLWTQPTKSVVCIAAAKR